MVRIPSAKTIAIALQLPKDTAKAIRKQLELGYEHGAFITHSLKQINELLNGHGIERIPKGNGDNSPAIVYVNRGDSYTPTILFYRGAFHVGCWGDIVESGDYQ